ncbi:MAG: carboxylesterase family protein [Alphaproteobacteria bacterium]|jgi:carboxylesterase type B|nr:carboxylesterase family protein [Alphaproteobacteria bacterium]
MSNASEVQEAGPVTSIESGQIEGLSENGVDAYKNIPFGADTGGANRFRPPQPVTPWQGIRPALEYGPWAPQEPGRLDRLKGAWDATMSEDCLNLNLWRPSGDNTGMPVMVYIHGGGFSYGSANHIAHDGSILARRGNMVVVSINYRLGVLGLLSHPCLRDPDTGYDGNWGFLDQIAGLQWINRNITAFGGDPDNVTIVGLSAGGGSVGALCICPQVRSGARPLFRRAVVQSSSPLPTPRSDHDAAAATLLDELGVEADLAADAIPKDDEQLRGILDKAGLDGDHLIPAYRTARRARGESDDTWALWIAMHTDRLIRVPSINFLADHAKRGNSAWACMVTRECDWVPPVPGDKALGATHVVDLPFMFGSLHATPELERLAGSAPGADELAEVIQDAYIAFIHTGSPVTEKLSAWRPYDGETRPTMLLGDELVALDDPMGTERQLMTDALAGA